MGKTYKDKRKWEKKQQEREELVRIAQDKKLTRKRLKEILPDGDEPDPYEEYEDR